MSCIPSRRLSAERRHFATAREFFLVQSLGIVGTLSWNTPSWSISCEAFAYIAFGAAMLFGLFRYRVVFMIATVLALAGYVAVALIKGGLEAPYDWGLIRGIAGFFFGMLIFEVSRSAMVSSLSKPAVLFGAEISVLALLVLALSNFDGVAVVLVIPLFVAAVALLQIGRGPCAAALASTDRCNSWERSRTRST